MSLEIAFINAEIDRAEQEGARSVNVNCKELREILRIATSNYGRAEIAAIGKVAGWVSAEDLRGIRCGRIRKIRMYAGKGEHFNVAVYFRAELKEYPRPSHELDDDQIPMGRPLPAEPA